MFLWIVLAWRDGHTFGGQVQPPSSRQCLRHFQNIYGLQGKGTWPGNIISHDATTVMCDVSFFFGRGGDQKKYASKIGAFYLSDWDETSIPGWSIHYCSLAFFMPVFSLSLSLSPPFADAGWHHCTSHCSQARQHGSDEGLAPEWGRPHPGRHSECKLVEDWISPDSLHAIRHRKRRAWCIAVELPLLAPTNII